MITVIKHLYLSVHVGDLGIVASNMAIINNIKVAFITEQQTAYQSKLSSCL